MLVPALLFFAIHSDSPLITPYARDGKLIIRSIKGEATVSQHQIEELRIDADGKYDNPFDPSDVSLDADVTTPSGKLYKMPGFFYRPFARSLDVSTEQLTPAGEADWRVRICPREVGKYDVLVHFKDRSGAEVRRFTFKTTPSNDPGFIGISPRDHHYFEFENGKPYFPIGANICWASPRGTYDYDDWLTKFSKNGCNYGRLWLSPQWTTLALEKSGKPQEGKGMGQFDLADAWRLDYVLDQARKDGIYMMLCIDSYNVLRERGAYPQWALSPQNQDNGGPLRIWSQFWTSPEMSRLYKNKLRYLVARYGADTHVFSWEFWNEVDLVQDFNREDVRSWHERMSDALHQIDPYKHLLTTSFSDSMGERSTDQLADIDYVQTHLYNNPDLAWGVSYQQARKSEWGKPHYVGEIGADSSGPRRSDDPQGLQVHDPLWVSLACGASGGAMSWWWDSLIAPKNLYGLYGAFSRFVSGIDFPGEKFQPIDAVVSYQDPTIVPGKGDLVIANGPASWQPDPANQPQSITVRGSKMEGHTPSELLHGLRNHKDLHNPLTITVIEPQDTEMQIEVNEVSTYGGAALKVTLDGDQALSKQFPAGEDNKDPSAAHRYDGMLSVQIPAGRHAVVIDNPGNDWLRLNYRFIGVTPRVGPPLNVWTLAGNSTVILWVRQSERNWKAIAVDKRQIPPVPPTYLELPGLAEGTYRLDLWDTWAGTVVSVGHIHVGLDGQAKVSLPTVTADLALKLTKEPAANSQ